MFAIESIREWREIAALDSRGQKVEATVLEKQEREIKDSDGKSYHLSLEFVVPATGEKVVRDEDVTLHQQLFASVKSGDPITVVFLPEAPRTTARIWPIETRNTLVSTAVALVWNGLLLSGVSRLFLLWRKRKTLVEDTVSRIGTSEPGGDELVE
jgi:hypothetical protein